MRRLKSPWTRAFLVWTVVLLVAVAVVAFGALVGFLRADGECFAQIGPCPQAGDQNSVQLAFAVFGIPLIWLFGLLVGVIAHSLANRKRLDAAP